MEKEEILSKIKSGIGQTNLSDRTLGAFVDNMIAGNAEIGDTHISSSVSFLKSLQGQYNHDVSEQIESFKKEHATQTPAKVPDKEPDPKENPFESQFKILSEKLESALSKIESKEKEEKVRLLKSEAMKIIKGKGADNEEVAEIASSLIAVDDSDTKETLAAKIEERYNNLYSKLYGKGVSPSGNGIAGKADSKAEKDAYMKHLIETNRIQQPKTN